MKIINQHGLPEAIVEAVRNDPYDKGDSDYSVTQLLQPPQVSALMEQHDDAIEEDCVDRIWSLFGSSVHAILERAEPSALTEDRLFADMEVDGKKITVSGQFDRLYLQKELLQDYKVTSIWTRIFGSRLHEWTQQLNFMRLLAAHNGYDNINKLEIVCIYRDWSAYQAKQNEKCPKQMVEKIDIPIWGNAKSAELMMERVRIHEQHRNVKPVPCTDEERWQQPTVYKIMKEGRKTSVKNFTNDEAGAHAYCSTLRQKNPKDTFTVQTFPGGYNRCEKYCSVNRFCPQYNARA